MLVPPWVQLVGLPLLILFGWFFATAASHAVVVFLIAGLISLLLNPIVRNLNEVGVPRAVAVLLVFGVFSLLIVVLSIAAVNTTINQAESVRANLPQYTQRIEHKIDDTQAFLDRRGIELDLRDQGVSFFAQLEEKSSEISGDALTYGRDFVGQVAQATFNVILVIVITVYMLLDAPRIARFVGSLLPGGSGIDVLFGRLENALYDYVRGQTLASIVMGVSTTVGLWLIGVTGLWPAATGLAVAFGVIVALTEFAPSIGPVLGSIPPIIAALFDGWFPAVVVALFFLLLHQIEGHVVIPKLMGAAIAVHPLLVIFGIIAGAQIMGPGGIFLVVPLRAVGKEIAMFLHEKLALEKWPEDARPVGALAESAAAAGAAAQTLVAAAGPATAAGAGVPSGGSARTGAIRERMQSWGRWWKRRPGDGDSGDDTGPGQA
jgi:predicted PurR-regulated permease PerM